MKKLFLFCISVFISTMMFSQVMIWKDGEVIYRKNIDEVDRVSFCEVEDFSLLKDTIELEYYGDFTQRRKWIHAEFVPKNSYGLLEYTSSNENVVMVSYDGCLISRGIGEANVTVKMLGTDIEKSCKVISKGYDGAFVWNSVIYLAPKQSYALKSAPLFFNPYCYYCLENLEFKSSDESVAKIVEANTIVALSLGEAVITATLKGTDMSSSAIVKVEDPGLSLIVDNNYMDSENNLVKMGKNATKMFSVVFENENFEESDRNNFYLWESTNEDVVTFVDYYGVEHYNNVVAVGEGEADVIVRLKGTNECDTIRVVVTPTDPQTVEFYNVLYEESLREYPLGYDIDYDGNDDVVREIVLWLLGGNLTWDDTKQAIVGEDYVIIVKTASVYAGTGGYILGRYDFENTNDTYNYLVESNGEQYFIPNKASASYLDTYSYCKYYEVLSQSGNVKREEFDSLYNWPIKETSSYIYYWDADNDDIYLAGCVNNGYFTISYEGLDDKSRTNVQVSTMQANLEFFADTPYGLLTEQKYDEETGVMREDFVTPLQMAPFIYRNVYFDHGYYKELWFGEALKTMQKIPEKTLSVKKLLNFSL